MLFLKAAEFHRQWKTPPGSLEEKKRFKDIRRGDSTRGLERIGRYTFTNIFRETIVQIVQNIIEHNMMFQCHSDTITFDTTLKCYITLCTIIFLTVCLPKSAHKMIEGLTSIMA